MGYMTFYYKDEELCSFSSFGITGSEVDATKRLFAIENGVDMEDILVVSELR